MIHMLYDYMSCEIHSLSTYLAPKVWEKLIVPIGSKGRLEDVFEIFLSFEEFTKIVKNIILQM